MCDASPEACHPLVVSQKVRSEFGTEQTFSNTSSQQRCIQHVAVVRPNSVLAWCRTMQRYKHKVSHTLRRVAQKVIRQRGTETIWTVLFALVLRYASIPASGCEIRVGEEYRALGGVRHVDTYNMLLNSSKYMTCSPRQILFGAATGHYQFSNIKFQKPALNSKKPDLHNFE